MTTAPPQAPDPATALAAALAECDALRAQVASLHRIVGWLREDVRAAGARRDTIRADAQRDLLRALDAAPESAPAVTAVPRQDTLEAR